MQLPKLLLKLLPKRMLGLLLGVLFAPLLFVLLSQAASLVLERFGSVLALVGAAALAVASADPATIMNSGRRAESLALQQQSRRLAALATVAAAADRGWNCQPGATYDS